MKRLSALLLLSACAPALTPPAPSASAAVMGIDVESGAVPDPHPARYEFLDRFFQR